MVVRRSAVLLATLAVVAAATLALALCWFEFSSVDLGYHIAYGRKFLDSGRIVECDPYIYAARDHFFVNANWAWQVLVAWMERGWGLAGLGTVRIAFMSATIAGVIGLSRRSGASWGATGLILTLAAMGAYERFDFRPELASYAIGAAQLWLVLRPHRRMLTACATTFGLQVLWVNSHSYFLIGPLTTAAMLAGDAARWFARERDAEGRRTAQLRLAMLAAQAAACFVNPWGVSGAAFPFTTLQTLRQQGVMSGDGGGAWSDIREFKAPLREIGATAGARVIRVYLLLLGLAAVGVAAALRTKRWGAALVIVLLAAMSLVMRRNIAMFALLATPLSAAAILAWLKMRPSLQNAKQAGGVVASLLALAAAGWWLPRVYSGRFSCDDQRVRAFGSGWSRLAMPIEACAFLRSQPALQQRLCTDFFSSSNTLPYLSAGWRIFIDTNTFAYPPEVMTALTQVTSGARPYGEFFDSQGVNVVLVHAAGGPIRELIRRLQASRDWALVHVDEAFVVFVRRIAAHAEIIASHTLTAASVDVESWVSRARRMHLPTGYALMLMARVPQALGWNEPAARLLRRAVELEDGLGLAWLGLGVTYGEMANDAIRQGGGIGVAKRYAQLAMECFQRAVRIEPENATARKNLEIATEVLRRMPS